MSANQLAFPLRQRSLTTLNAFALMVAISPIVNAETTVYAEQGKLFNGARKVTSLGADLFGDKVNLYSGGLEFVQTDVSLPGNSALPVGIGRRLTTAAEPNAGMFGNWDLEVPHLHGIYANKGWTSAAGDAATRCSRFGAPQPATGAQGGSWNGTEFWHGSFLYVPGAGDQEMLHRSSTYRLAPSNNPDFYPIVTRNHWQIRCLPSMDSRSGVPGEAFLAISPDGTTYQFDWLVQRSASTLTKTSAAPSVDARTSFREADAAMTGVRLGEQNDLFAGDTGSGGYFLTRQEVWILPTRVTDRFGNTVVYTYNPAEPWQLQSVVGNDVSGSPRTISLAYAPPIANTNNHRISSVFDGTRTWTYTYGSGTDANTLHTVTLPDQSRWQLGGLRPLSTELNYESSTSCEVPGFVNVPKISGTLVHPSGASGTFELNPVLHGRAGVPRECKESLPGLADYPIHAKTFDTLALTKKTVSGPGLPSMEWTTTYSAAKSSWAPWDGRDGSKQVEVRNPDGNFTRYTYGTVFRSTEGQLQVTEQLDMNREVLRSTALRYMELGVAGNSDQRRGDGEMGAKIFEVDQRGISQQGTLFTWQGKNFNEFFQPTEVTRTRSGAGSRSESTEYANNVAKWVLGRIKKVTEKSTGKVAIDNRYNATTANLEEAYSFSVRQKALSYNADGTVAIERDGLNRETRYTNYKRGIPQNVSFPNGTAMSAVINNLGAIDSVTSASGATTMFGYDAMGRFSAINYAGGDPVTWNATTIAFNQVWAPEYDLEPGHWRQTITTGSGVETSYFDALWRPVYAERWDNNDRTNTQSIVRYKYDADGRSTFESYPMRTHGEIGAGIYQQYDALGRLVAIYADSEKGQLLTSFWYNPSVFEKVQTNARKYPTTYQFQAFDEPSEDAITNIAAPEGVAVTITRDVFGKTQAITRSGGGKSLTRNYVYDTYQRLCKIIEPETGATVQDYDGANNVSWRASGLTLLSTGSCDQVSVPAPRKMSFGYDLLNRLETTTYGDNSPAIARTYTLDGQLKTISSNGALWTYEYNKRQLNWKETLNYGGRDYMLERAYDANGSVSQLKYPLDNLTVYYSPNAFGKASQVGSFAQGVRYHPNGAIKEFTYGNGIRHVLEQNTRGLPARTYDAVSESYVYDANGNLEQITDHLWGDAGRTMTYDALDRLSTASSRLWGSATYGYDSLDNMMSTSISGGANARNLFHAFNPGTNRLDSVSGGPAGFNFSYAYDLQGNVTQRGGQVYRFDIGNRLRSVEGRATYAYDGHGRRVSLVGKDGANTVQIYTQGGQLLYSGPAAGGGAKYVYLNNHQVAEVK